jgi:tRNA (guanine-N7-)-methyltransferase
VREHVNPLSRKYQQAIAPPDWQSIYGDLAQPLQLDIGCGKGRFLLNMAQLQPNWNFLGLEIREPLVHQANDWKTDLSLTNLYYLFCNVNTSLQPLLQSLPANTLQRVSIQFPDPWFKRKHQKRRVVQPEVVTILADFLVKGGEVFLQSDVPEVEQEMCDRFTEHPAFQRTAPTWLSTNPMPIPTERETSTLERGEAVYRAVYIRR